MNSVTDHLAVGLPHSEIPGSTIARISPGLFAACCVLHRLSVPRHPPDALFSSPSPRPTANPRRRGIHEDTLGDTPPEPLRAPRSCPAVTSRLSLHPSINPPPAPAGDKIRFSPSIAAAPQAVPARLPKWR